jgi:hypothetical protein
MSSFKIENPELLLKRVAKIWKKNIGEGSHKVSPGDVTATVFMAIDQLTREAEEPGKEFPWSKE